MVRHHGCHIGVQTHTYVQGNQGPPGIVASQYLTDLPLQNHIEDITITQMQESSSLYGSV